MTGQAVVVLAVQLELELQPWQLCELVKPTHYMRMLHEQHI